MVDKKKCFKALKSIPWLTVGIILLFFLFALLMLKSNVNNTQASTPNEVSIYFEGEYRIDGGAWKKIEKGQHISATKGDVTLRGHFQMSTNDGERTEPARIGTSIALFLDHINVKIYESGQRPYEIHNENPSSGASSCGEIWTTYVLQGGAEDPIEIVIHNPHKFGNDTAVDSFLSEIDLYTGIDFESDVLSKGDIQRNIGLLFCIVSIVLLGVALFSTLIRVKKAKLIWMFGFVTLFAGVYLTYSTLGTYFWSEFVAINTTVVGVSMMYYMLFIVTVIALFFEKTQLTGKIVSVALGIADAVFVFLPLLTSVRFYDTLLIWAIVQTLANVIMFVCIIKEIVSVGVKKRCAYIGIAVALLSFEIDALATALGLWQGGIVSQYTFFVIFLSALAVVLFVIPQNIIALSQAKESEMQRRRLEIEKNAIEAELKESRVAIMLSQIRPHFIYNTLGTIERLCLKDPQMAFELVRNFSLYLRGNFSELDSVAPILFSDEMKHVQYYVNIEKVRFPDITVEYQLEVTDFAMPAISVQPLVENAIKHGLMPLEQGGMVVIRSYETETHFCVEVSDNGAGFDTNATVNKKEHVGLYNIRERLKSIVNGDLIIESTVGKGTKATIMIPKEETV